jgi:peptidoglycan/xylan/chitin deacetylase (PgdA/CDA1 family)
MNIKLDRFPGGVFKSMTLSYDDGRDYDRRMIEIMNRNGIRGSFHLNSGNLGKTNFLRCDEIASLFDGHEVSAHTVEHPFLELVPKEKMALEILEDRKRLEDLVKYPVRGMSYPYGTYDNSVKAMMPMLGIEYARTVKSHGTFTLPEDFLEWHPTCHHREMLKYAEAFLELKQKYPRMALFYVWGHSYEFHNNDNWEDFTKFCEMVGGRKDIWYATNIEIMDYVYAVKALRFSVSQTMVYNPTATSVWISVNNESVEVPAGSQLNL